MTETINHRDVTNLEELNDALDVLTGDSDSHHASTVQIRMANADGVRLYLEEETLSDGSKVLNINIIPLR